MLSFYEFQNHLLREALLDVLVQAPSRQTLTEPYFFHERSHRGLKKHIHHGDSFFMSLFLAPREAPGWHGVDRTDTFKTWLIVGAVSQRVVKEGANERRITFNLMDDVTACV